MSRDRLTGFGLVLAALGWGVLIADLFVAEAVLKAGNLVAVTALRADVATLSQTAILSGIGLALLGTMRRGFGTLNRFFDAVMPPVPAPRFTPILDERPEPQAPLPPAAPERGPARDQRNYVILPDGSVEVETLLGTRVFASLAEARDFIRERTARG